jgi:hypothetical protein
MVHGKKERRIIIIIIIIITIIIITRYDYNLTIMKSPKLTLSTHISNFDDIGQWIET